MIKRIAAVSSVMILICLVVLFGGQLIKSKSLAVKGDFLVSPEKAGAEVDSMAGAVDNEFYEKVKEISQKNRVNVCMADDWIYYSNPEDGNKLYKAREDWSEKELLIGDVTDEIKIDGNWIYYQNLSDRGALYKIKTDGSGRQKLNDDRFGWPTIMGEWVYFENASDEARLYKIKKDGTEKTRITDGGACWLAADGVYIYFNGSEPGRQQEDNIKRINTGTKTIEKISDEAGILLTLDGDWIYFLNVSDEYKLYKMKKDGTQKTKLSDIKGSNMQVLDDWIYFTGNEANMGTRIYRTNKEGTNAICISSDPAGQLCAAGRYVYYNLMGSLYRIGNNDDKPMLVAGTGKNTANAALDIFPDVNEANAADVGSKAPAEYQRLDKLTEGALIADIDIDEKGDIYILDANALYGKAMQKGETVSSIKVYDSNQEFKYEITLKDLDSCSSIAVQNDKILIYNINNEKVYVYSTDGNLSDSFEALAGKQSAVRMDTDSEGRLYIFNLYNPGRILIFNNKFDQIDEIGGSDFEMMVKDAEKLQEKNPGKQDSSRKIQDFTIVGEGYILIKTEPQRLCLYNINTKEVEKVLNLSDYADLVAYYDGMLYYTSSIGDASLSHKENYFGPEPGRVGRLRITEDTFWSTDYNFMTSQGIHLEKFDIPHFSHNSTHMRMLQTESHIYFLDLNNSVFPASQKPEKIEFKQSIYRILK